MKKNSFSKLTILLTICILLSTLTITQAQINITPEQLRITNKIFAEHKHQKLIIKEQDNQINLFENKVATYEHKVEILEQVIENKDSIFSLTEKKHSYEIINLENSITGLKKQKRQLTFLAILTTVISLGVIFAK